MLREQWDRQVCGEMASLRSASRLFSQAARLSKAEVPKRCLNTKQAGTGYAALRPLILGAAAVGGAVSIYQLSKDKKISLTDVVPTKVACAAAPSPQPSVISGTKEHALYLWIQLSPKADAKACARVVANLPAHVDAVCPPDLRDESDEVWAGVGFGPNFYSKIGGKSKQNYAYATKSGSLGAMPAKSGDIFIHAKSDSTSKLLELAQRVLAQLPKGSVASFEDVYGFVFRGGRDLSGFIDGTENPADDDERFEEAVENGSGGSYVITQKWIHNLEYIAQEKDNAKEGFVGRQIEDSTELKNKSATSHVARMVGGTDFEQKKRFKIVRQSQPYGNLHDKAGLFFIAYTKTPDSLNYMLDRMTGKDSDKQHDDIMRLTTCVASTYWYFPGEAELRKLL